MHHIRKQDWMGCAVAAAAMISDLDYEDVAAHLPDLDPARLRWPRELRALLESVTDTEWRLTQCRRPLRPVREFAFPAWPIAAFIQDDYKYPRFGHWVAVRDEIVHDPGEARVHLASKFPRSDWLVAWTAQPVCPVELARSRVRNRLRRIRNVLRPLAVVDG
jgi:hypothetical protein